MATPAQRSSAARIAADISWTRTPVRAERTAPATAANPGSLAWHEARLRAEGVVSEADIRAAAVNARRAYMSQLAKRRHSKRLAEQQATQQRTA